MKTLNKKLLKNSKLKGKTNEELVRLPPPPEPNVFDSARPVNHGASPRGWHAIVSKFLCDKKFQLEHRWKVHKPMTATPDALGTGGLFHQGRAHWFNSGFASDAKYQSQMHDFVREAALLYPLPVKEDVITRTLSYLDQYVEYWSARVRPKVLGVEYKLTANILGPEFDDRTARLDDVSQYPDTAPAWSNAIGECKTTSVSVADAVLEYTLHGQPVKQAILWEMAPEGERKHGPIDFIMLDVIVKGYGKEKCKFGRVPIRITDYTKNWYLPMLARQVKEAEAITTETPVLRNITNCTRLIGRMRVPCEYMDLCQRGKSAAVAYVDEKGVALSNEKYTKREGAKPWD